MLNGKVGHFPYESQHTDDLLEIVTAEICTIPPRSQKTISVNLLYFRDIEDQELFIPEIELTEQIKVIPLVDCIRTQRITKSLY